ncbi:hypothetical protein OG21DRAFT_1606337 [Imleria badia]|nr:hypothetical protein OG21DRAFT_1606337 [Imleria badia]
MTLGDEVQTLLSGRKKHVSSEPISRNCISIAPVIMLAQISLCIFAWTFAGFMMHETIALPDNIARWIQNHSNDTQTIITLLSTILALINSSLLGKNVQYALVHRLSSAQLRLHTMVEWAKLAQRSISLNFERRRLSWTLLSVTWVGLLGFLTTAWSSLLVPQSVVIYYNIQGNDNDLLSPSMSDTLGPYINEYQSVPGFNLTLTDIISLSDLYSNLDLAATLMDAGFWAASANVSLNSYAATNFISIYGSLYVSNVSTGGILPTGDLCAPSSPYLGTGNPSYQGLSTTYNVTQRGFTADVFCRTPTSDDPTITLSRMNSVPINASDYDSWTVDTYSWSTNCSPEIRYFTMGVTVAGNISADGQNNPGGGLLMTSVCFGQNFTGSSNQSFLVLFDSPQSSSYSGFGPQICEVTPLITTVQTTFGQTPIINLIQPPLDQYPLPDPTSNNVTGILFFPAFMIWSTFENYLRGMMEYLGSLMAQLEHNATLGTQVQGEGVQFYATATAHTFGWTFHLRTHGPALVAITLVTALTVAAGGFAMLPIDRYEDTNRKPQAGSAHAFDPTATLDVLLASSAGDLARLLDDKEGDQDRHGHDSHLRIALGMTDTGRPALKTVSVDEETRASADVERRGSLATRLEANSASVN